MRPALAATPLDSMQYQPQMSPPGLSTGGIILRMALSLVIVIGLILVLVVLLRFLQRNTLLSRQGAWAKVIDRIGIGPNKMLALVEIFGKVYVLGVTDHGISTLLNEQEIDLSHVHEVVADVERKKAIPGNLGNSFLQLLDSKLHDLRKNYPWPGKEDHRDES
jgi:flagellar biogenesis protein FliO